jgi:hypothetical protein
MTVARARRGQRRTTALVVKRGNTRADQVDAELRYRATRLESDFLTIVELCQEVIERGYYARFQYRDAESYLEQRIGLSYRSVRRRLGTIEAIQKLPANERKPARAALVEIGSHKASIVAPALRNDPSGWREWVGKAKAVPEAALQQSVSLALGHRPRGTVVARAAQPGETWYARVLAPPLPDELRELTQRVFKLAEVALEKLAPNPFECWAAICQEFLATYEPKGVATNEVGGGSPDHETELDGA